MYIYIYIWIYMNIYIYISTNIIVVVLLQYRSILYINTIKIIIPTTSSLQLGQSDRHRRPRWWAGLECCYCTGGLRGLVFWRKNDFKWVCLTNHGALQIGFPSFLTKSSMDHHSSTLSDHLRFKTIIYRGFSSVSNHTTHHRYHSSGTRRTWPCELPSQYSWDSWQRLA